MRRFFLRLFGLFVLLSGIAALAALALGWAHPAIRLCWWALIFFLFITALTGWMGLRALHQSARGFVTSVSLMVTAKLLGSALFVALYAWLTKPQSPMFIIPFFILYIFFTVFEIRELIIAQKRVDSAAAHKS
ncbi:MAG: hypothetical protein NZL95_00140 [Chitinophagales bacterium]|nr:hypothetical protein [Chitinophagales bacterium]MDW8426949.1 hypothetical protein [Chitinophagales bacterium]